MIVIQLLSCGSLTKRGLSRYTWRPGLMSEYSMFPQALHSQMHVEERGAAACSQLWLGLAEKHRKNSSFCCSLFVGFAARSTQKKCSNCNSEHYVCIESAVLWWFQAVRETGLAGCQISELHQLQRSWSAVAAAIDGRIGRQPDHGWTTHQLGLIILGKMKGSGGDILAFVWRENGKMLG